MVFPGGDAVEFPSRANGPVRNILVRVAIAVSLVTFVALLTYVGREGYVDADGGVVSLLDSFYYSTVRLRRPATATSGPSATKHGS